MAKNIFVSSKETLFTADAESDDGACEGRRNLRAGVLLLLDLCCSLFESLE
jgi:hypothetical protein